MTRKMPEHNYYNNYYVQVATYNDAALVLPVQNYVWSRNSPLQYNDRKGFTYTEAPLVSTEGKSKLLQLCQGGIIVCLN